MRHPPSPEDMTRYNILSCFFRWTNMAQIPISVIQLWPFANA